VRKSLATEAARRWVPTPEAGEARRMSITAPQKACVRHI
jgi:hypothetical protein